MRRRLASKIAMAALAGGLVLSAGGSAEAQVLLHIQGTFVPGLPYDQTGHPYVDYVLTVSTPGTVTIDLTSSNTSYYDPYLRLFLGSTEIAYNDDGGGGLNSQIVQFLQPGVYTVRVSKFGSGPVSMPVPFTLTAMGTSPAVGAGVVGMGPVLTEALAMSLATQFYHTQSEWAGQYLMSPVRTRLVPTGLMQYQAHIQYQYSCVQPRCRGASSGFDQRVFYLQVGPGGWQVTHMGPHMSAVF